MKSLSAIVLIIFFWIPGIVYPKGCDTDYLESATIEDVVLTWGEDMGEEAVISNVKIGNTIFDNKKNVIVLLTFNIRYVEDGREEKKNSIGFFDMEKCEVIHDGFIKLKPVSI